MTDNIKYELNHKNRVWFVLLATEDNSIMKKKKKKSVTFSWKEDSLRKLGT